MIGRTVGNYRILEKLGEGGMGTVFKGIDVMVEREVAVKMLKPELARRPEVVDRFRSEAVTLAKLNHPNIATLFSFFRQGDEFFMVMEFVPGRTLESLVRDHGPMTAERAVPVFLQVLAAIEHAHQFGVLHRDIKPANIMLTAAGAVKVTDFGIARIIGAARMTRQGNIVGTLEYIAPERVRGEEHDARSDIYSLGAVLYEMLSGRLPFARDNEFALMQAHLNAPPPALNGYGLNIPFEIEAAAMRALAKPPQARFPTAGEFSMAIQTAAAQAAARAAQAPRATRLASAPTPVPTRLAAPAVPPVAARSGPAWVLWVAVAFFAVLMAAAGVWFAAGRSSGTAAKEPAATPAALTQAPAPRPADPGIPAPRELPKGIQRSPAREILKNSIPIPEPAPPPVRVVEDVKPAAPAVKDDGEKRRAALRALEQGNAQPAEAEARERERKRLEALKALQK